MPRTCINNPDRSCHVCGELTFISERKNFKLS